MMTYGARDVLRRIVKYAVMIAVSAAIGIFLGHLISNYEMRFMANRSLYGEYKGIEIYTVGEVNEKIMSNYLYMLSCAPDELTECCDRLYFTGSDLDIPENDVGVDSALGLTQGRTIYISTEWFGMEVMFHELFHAYDNVNGELSSSEQFRDVFWSERNNIYVAAGYEEMYPSEFFAQGGAFYLLSHERLKEDAPLTYAYFNSIFSFFE